MTQLQLGLEVCLFDLKQHGTIMMSSKRANNSPAGEDRSINDKVLHLQM